ncbi:MerR family transcriptional regulator [Amycolatopsis echigonensis]|uniref:MerR family transcriptional regulator n=1 Tax=Amycolatopsis echigonensis TaxID=2576905 RepID=UPI001FE8F36B|nr:MerR family transcriptional regulator [Amycolatopsis echigonensis]
MTATERTLRYYDELGVVRPAEREAGRRRYAESAVEDVGVLSQEIGFTLSEIGRHRARTRTTLSGQRSVEMPAVLVDRRRTATRPIPRGKPRTGTPH